MFLLRVLSFASPTEYRRIVVSYDSFPCVLVTFYLYYSLLQLYKKMKIVSCEWDRQHLLPGTWYAFARGQHDTDNVLLCNKHHTKQPLPVVLRQRQLELQQQQYHEATGAAVVCSRKQHGCC